MSNRFDFGGVNLRADEDGSKGRPRSETPFCVAILGDFSGRASRGISEPRTVGQRRPYLIDRDNFDEVMSKLKIELHLPSGGDGPVVFRFSEMDDFHPDRLLQTEPFQQLRDLREQLQDPNRFVSAAEKAGLLRPQATPAPPRVQNVVAPSAARLASGSLLDELVEETESRLPERSKRTDALHDFARQLSAKYAVSTPDARQPEVIAAVDRAIGDAMRAILHHPEFQALEAIWRSTFLLARRLDTGSQLRLYIFDISGHELAADLHEGEGIEETGLYHLLVEEAIQTPGADPWSLVLASYRFEAEDRDIQQLSRMAKIAHVAGAAVVTEASPTIVGCRSLAETPHPRDWNTKDVQSWAALRALPEASSLAMALPRFLLRLPYGSRTSALESIEFEEFAAAPEHGQYLWGNPAFAVGLMLSQSFGEAGWEMQPGSVAQVNDLPLHVYVGRDGPESKPCAEVLLTDEAVQRILDRGLIPLISYKGRDSVRAGRFQSVAEGGRALGGRWEA